jgi:saccharopine dehydrogenase-like NADP-dependent oxidoreductase
MACNRAVLTKVDDDDPVLGEDRFHYMSVWSVDAVVSALRHIAESHENGTITKASARQAMEDHYPEPVQIANMTINTYKERL